VTVYKCPPMETFLLVDAGIATYLARSLTY
jgi:hypothetical protein